MKVLGPPKQVKTEKLKTHPAWSCLFGYSRAAVNKLAEKIKATGDDASEPIIYARFQTGDGNADEGIADGYQCRAAAHQIGCVEVWVQEIEFESLKEAINFAKERLRLCKKAGNGDLLDALCVREDYLVPHGENRRGKSAEATKLQTPNLISGVTHKMCETMKRVTNQQIAELYGAPKHTVDHVRSKYDPKSPRAIPSR